MAISRLKTTALSIAAFVLALPSPVLAWGGEGHVLIMRLAYMGLPPHLQRRFDEILHGASIRHQYRHRNSDGDLVDEDCQADDMEELAIWADCVRYDSDPHFGSTRSYHFDDIPFYPPMPAWGEWCEPRGCGTRALAVYFRTLRESHDPVERLEALAYVVHFVGDLHQPLHTIENNDSGGNLIRVTVNGNRTNLHSFWDSGLLRLAYRDTDPIAAVRLAARNNEAIWGQEMDPDAWVRESHAIAIEAYRRLRRVPPKNRGSWNGGSIGPSYVRYFSPKMEDQLGRAVVRLRNVLARELS